MTYTVPGEEFNTSVLFECTQNCISGFANTTNQIDMDIVPRGRNDSRTLGQLICDTFRIFNQKDFISTFDLHAVIDWLKPDGSQQAAVTNVIATSKTRLACKSTKYYTLSHNYDTSTTPINTMQ